MAAASGHTVSGVSERGPVINQAPHQIQNQASVKEVWSLSSVPRVSFRCFFLSTTSCNDDWEGRLRVLVMNLRTMKVVHWVNVSDSSGVDLSQ